jgi:lysylphosphatidylglycerol synthetase-like protein (DUF2156 family)
MRRKKEYDFVVTLKHPGYKVYNTISILLCVMTAVAEIFGLLHSGFTTMEWIKAGLVVFIIIYLLAALLFFNRRKYIVGFGWVLFASAVLWFLAPLNNVLLGLLFIAATFFEAQLKFPQEIGFDNDEIAFNHFPSKHYSWQEIQNVILKDNIITIDFKNNSILQKETETDTKPELEKEFNEFCRQHLLQSVRP